MRVLSPKNVSLQSLRMINRYSMNAETNPRLYTVEEIGAMLDQAEANFAAGLGISGEEVFREIEEEFEKEDQLESK